MILDKLLNNLPAYFNKVSKPRHIFTVNGAVSVTVDTDARTVRVNDGIRETFIDIKGKNISLIKEAIYIKENLISNPGFETGDFTSWSVRPASAEVVSDEKHTGKYCATYYCEHNGAAHGISQDIPINKTKTYRYSAYLKTTGVKYWISFYVNFLDKDKKYIGHTSKGYRNIDWTLASMTLGPVGSGADAEFPADTAYLQIFPCRWYALEPAGEARVWIDDVSVGEVNFSISVATNVYDNLLFHTLVSKTDGEGKVWFERSLNRRLLNAIAQFLIDCHEDYSDAVENEMYFGYTAPDGTKTTKAQSFWLDLWGSFFGWKRYEGEPDIDYYARIMHEILSIKTNNKALEKLIADTGIVPRVDVVDHEYERNTFKVQIYADIDQATDLTKKTIRGIIEKYRAVGCVPIYYGQTNILRSNTKKYYGATALTGTVSIMAGTNTLTGTGTLFTTELSIGDMVQIENENFAIVAISSDTELTLSASHLNGATDVVGYKLVPPTYAAGVTDIVDADTFKVTGDRTEIYTSGDGTTLRTWLVIAQDNAVFLTEVASNSTYDSVADKTTVNITDANINTAGGPLNITHLIGERTNDLNWVSAPNPYGWIEVTL